MYVYTHDALGHTEGMRHAKPEVCSKLAHYKEVAFLSL